MARLELLGAEERAARAEGYRLVAGVDEAGRGCLAGSVWAGAVVLGSLLRGLDDSKRLEPEVREDLARRIRRTAAGWGTGSSSSAEIDALGIVAATGLAMGRALGALRASGVQPDLVLFDAFSLQSEGASQRSYIGGDRRVACIAAASVLAKTSRDAEMEAWHLKCPWYGWDANRGYGTPAHLEALARHGPSPLHRLSFRRVLPRTGKDRASRTIDATQADVS